MQARARQTLLVAVAAILTVVIAGAGAASALAGAASPQRQNLVDTTVRFLQESQRPNGGFANSGKAPSQSISAWVAIALEAAGINPQDQATCGIDAFTYLESHFPASYREEAAAPEVATTAFERELLVVDGAGADPHDFAGTDLVAEILGRQLPDGSFSYVPGGRGEINDTAFAVLALSPVAEPATQGAVARALDWLETQQNEDGAWSWQVKGATDNVDLTGAVLEALNAGGRHGSAAQAAALGFLHRAQRPDGGFTELGGGGESNVASTAWAVQGLWAADEDPEAWRTGAGPPSEEPLDYMEGLQQPDGHVRWKRSSDLNGIWMTAYVAPAFAGQALPVPRVARALPGSPPAEGELPASCAEPVAGQAGEESTPPGSESPQSRQGVIAGGGGSGAPDFSRPQPQSQGRTPGGARNVHKLPGAKNHSETRRGENPRQPRGSERSEPAGAQAAKPPPAVVSESGGEPGSGTDGPSGGASGRGESGAGDRGVPLTGAARAASGGPGREVRGTLIGDPAASRDGKLAFGAPGLRSGGGNSGDEETRVAIGIGAVALLGALGGAQWERRRGVALP